MTYLAKKRAEVSPGVGEKTDIFVINHEGWRPLQKQLPDLQTLYIEYEDYCEKKLEETQQKITIDLRKIPILRGMNETLPENQGRPD